MTEESAPSLPSGTAQVELEGKTVYIVGTAHVSAQSVQDVRAAVAAVRPDAIAIELCEPRYQGLVKKAAWRNTNLFQLIKQKKATFLLAQLALQAFYRRLLLAGALAAVLVTWFTFLPSFLFIFAGGPLVESTHGDLKFTAPLTAITAAVVGVIVNLAVFFGYPVLWPAGFSGAPDFVAAVIALGAAVALFRFKANVIHVIAACAGLGLAARLLA